MAPRIGRRQRVLSAQDRGTKRRRQELRDPSCT